MEFVRVVFSSPSAYLNARVKNTTLIKKLNNN